MIPILLLDELPFINAEIEIDTQVLATFRLLIDTGSSATLLNADTLEQFGIVASPSDVIKTMRGIGGIEYVVQKSVASLRVAHFVAKPFAIQIGELNYEVGMDGIIGCDFLRLTRAVVDFDRMELRG